MSDLRSKAIKLAASMPKGDPTRRELLAAVQDMGFQADPNLVWQARVALEEEVKRIQTVKDALLFWQLTHGTVKKAFNNLRKDLEKNYRKHEDWDALADQTGSAFMGALSYGLDAEELDSMFGDLDKLDKPFGTLAKAAMILNALGKLAR
jgi:hypothetical protein